MKRFSYLWRLGLFLLLVPTVFAPWWIGAVSVAIWSGAFGSPIDPFQHDTTNDVLFTLLGYFLIADLVWCLT